jgi:fluoride exporter
MTSRWRLGRFGRSRFVATNQHDQTNTVGPDVDPAISAQRRELLGHPVEVLGVIAVGGVMGAEARYAVGFALPHTTAAWPWATLVVNAVGSFLIGVLMVVIVELLEAHRLVRPFLGVGVLGGFTTFSTYAVDALFLTSTGRVGVAVYYMVLTPVVAVLACAVGAMLARVLARRSVRGPSQVQP